MDFSKYRLILAPMVEQSDLAWRQISRKYNCQLCYTPMIHAKLFVDDTTYQFEQFIGEQELANSLGITDRPLIVQFCANDVETFVNAGKIVEKYNIDGVDLNLGCPQRIARRGNYGAYLQENVELVRSMLTEAAKTLKVPVTAKIRRLETVERSVEYAKMLENCGIKMLTVHGRLREERGPNTGLADWHHISAIKKALSIPVYGNGNIQYFDDIERCLKETGCDGVMVAESSLNNFKIFKKCSKNELNLVSMAEEYLYNFAIPYKSSLSITRAHLFKLLQRVLEHQPIEMRSIIAKSNTVQDLADGMKKIRNEFDAQIEEDKDVSYVYYEAVNVLEKHSKNRQCSMERPTMKEKDKEKIRKEKIDRVLSDLKMKRKLHKEPSEELSQLAIQDFSKYSLKRLKRMIKRSNKNKMKSNKIILEKCRNCLGNPLSERCTDKFCKKCCHQVKNGECSYHRRKNIIIENE
ncbi:hypothetical protein SNEBB_004237 [Seison nebaliae]|nr:hypothetical protein SNEBB_004237 [Seison nebaliae]